MERHACQLPLQRRSVDAPRTWTCPDCGDVWEVRPLEPMNLARHYDFATAEHLTNAEWARVVPDEDGA